MPDEENKDASGAAAENGDHGRTRRRDLEEIISRCLEKSIRELHSDYYAAHKDRLRQVVRKSLSFPRDGRRGTQASKGNNGKPHDAETRIALTLYHQWKREAAARPDPEQAPAAAAGETGRGEDPLQAGRPPALSPARGAMVTITSDLGLEREVSSPRQLADLLCPLLEEEFRNHPQWKMAPDVRSQPSGIVSMMSLERSELLRQAGRLPCPHCIQWCRGEKGLWWHQQQYHRLEYATATNVAQATSIGTGAMVVYDENLWKHRANKTNKTGGSAGTGCTASLSASAASTAAPAGSSDGKGVVRSGSGKDPIDHVREGNLEGLKNAVENHGYRPSRVFDEKGSTPLLWAAGGGHLDITRYLVEVCGCDPCQSQRGKRSFWGRTALHWASRNGHLEVVQYLLSLATSGSSDDNGNRDNDDGPERSPRSVPLGQLLEAKTGDGTTAFGWACWQRHLPVMECLYGHGCDIHGRNSYGCSPVLWCSQGKGPNGLGALQWLRDRGCDLLLVNHNGHGVLHKAAQRGQAEVAEWLVRSECSGLLGGEESSGSRRKDQSRDRTAALLALVGPDAEGYCPSDLAGMEGHWDLAVWLADAEVGVCLGLGEAPPLPGGSEAVSCAGAARAWEKHGGLRRMRSALDRPSR